MATNYDRIRADHLKEYGEGTRHLAFLGRLYPDRTHFLFELLQNAEDARATRVHFELFPDRLEVRHDGRAFNERDVRAICGVDAASKADDPTQIGKFGIGFKSVYAYTAEPAVHSGDEHFRIESYVRPHAAPPRSLQRGETLFVLPFSREDVPAHQAALEIGTRLHRLEVATLLFLRSIARVTWHIPGDTEGLIERQEAPWSAARRVTLCGRSGAGEERAEWLVFSRSQTLAGANSPPAGTARWVEVAFRLIPADADRPARIVPVPNAPLVVVFPTEKETHLGLVAQGPYRTTPARDNVPADDAWNRHLVNETAALLAEALPQLRDLGLLTTSLLETLPLRGADFVPGSLFHPIFERVRDLLRADSLLPAATGGFVRAALAKLPASPEMAACLSEPQLDDLLADQRGLRWIAADIAADRNTDLHTYLRTHLGIEEITPATLAARLDEAFMTRQSDEWVTRFYAFLGAHPDLWQRATGVWNDADGPLRGKAWLRLADGTHVPPFRADGEPRAYLPPAQQTDYPIVKREIAAAPSAREFLLRLGLREPDVVAEVLERVLVKYAPGAAAPPTPAEHGRDLEKIFRALGTDSEMQKSRLLQRLQRTAFVHVENAATGEEAFRRPTAAYLRRPELERYFAGNPAAWFVAESLADLGSREQWAALGVAGKPRRLGDELALSVEEKRELRARQRMGWTGDRDATDYELDGLAHFLEHFADDGGPAMRQKALALWTLLAEHVDDWPGANRQRFFEGEYRWYYHGEDAAAYFPAAFVARLRNAAWLPSRTGGWLTPGAVALEELPEEFTREEGLAMALGMRLDAFDAFASSHGVDPDLLRFAVEHPEAIDAVRRQHRAGRAAGDGSLSSTAETDTADLSPEKSPRPGADAGEDDWARFWTLDPAVAFLNHGSFGACPGPVLEEQQRLRARLEREPVQFLARDLESLLDAARAELAGFVGAAAEDLVFVPNATTAVNAVLRSLRFTADDDLLITNHAYQACRNALDFVAERSGARVVVAEVPFPIESPASIVEAVMRQVTPRTRLALLDHVTSPTGLIFPIQQLVAELAARGVDTLVDGAHAPGMIPLRITAIGAAYYTGNCHKWLCAPKGSAFLHVRRDRQPAIRPLTISHGASARRNDRSRFLLEFDWTGTGDPTAYLCVPHAIRFLGGLLPGGWPALMDRNQRIALAMRRRLCEALHVPLPSPDEMIGALAAIPLADAPPADPPLPPALDPLQDTLLHRYGIEVPIIPWPTPTQRLLRIGVQLYNTPGDYEYLITALAELLAS